MAWARAAVPARIAAFKLGAPRSALARLQIGQDRDPHLGSDVIQGTRLEVASFHPVFDGAEDLLDRSPPGSHCAGHVVKAALHGLDELFVLPSLDAPFDGGGAVRLYGAAESAGGRGVIEPNSPPTDLGRFTRSRGLISP